MHSILYTASERGKTMKILEVDGRISKEKDREMKIGQSYNMAFMPEKSLFLPFHAFTLHTYKQTTNFTFSVL